MEKQMTMSFWADKLAKVRIRKKEFLEQVEQFVPWDERIKKIQPYYYKGERWNKPYDQELIIRTYVLQNLCNLAGMVSMNVSIDSCAFSAFCRVDSSNQISDGGTTGRFRNILIKHHM